MKIKCNEKKDQDQSLQKKCVLKKQNIGEEM